jgi:hypothetical protein
MGISVTGNKIHDAAVLKAEVARQVSYSAAGSQAALKAADIAFHRAAKASAIANGIQPGVYVEALFELGTGGA